MKLKGKIALVAGATRGAGRGIACMLGAQGAKVYCTGRSTKDGLASGEKRKETIEETAQLVNDVGGEGVFVKCDHTQINQVTKLMEQIRKSDGKLDILINDVWGGDSLTEWGTPFWDLEMEKGFEMVKTAIHSHIITAKYAVKLLMNSDHGLIVEVTDGDTYGYRGNLFYDWVKTSVIRLAFGMAWELRRKNITCVAVTPGFLRSEAMLDHFGVTEENWKEGVKKDKHFIASESPYFVGRAIAELASDTNHSKKNGKVYSSWVLSREYGFTDIDGSSPDWGKYAEETFGELKYCDEQFYSYWFNGMMDKFAPDWP